MNKTKLGLLALVLGMIFSAPSFAQNFGATPEDSLSCRKNVFLYNQRVKGDAYEEAHHFLTKVFEVCPEYGESIYINGEIILKKLAKTTEDPERKKVYVDSLMNIYEGHLKYFGNKATIKARYGVDLLKLNKDFVSAYKVLDEAVAELKEKSSPGTIAMYYTALYYTHNYT